MKNGYTIYDVFTSHHGQPWWWRKKPLMRKNRKIQSWFAINRYNCSDFPPYHRGAHQNLNVFHQKLPFMILLESHWLLPSTHPPSGLLFFRELLLASFSLKNYSVIEFPKSDGFGWPRGSIADLGHSHPYYLSNPCSWSTVSTVLFKDIRIYTSICHVLHDPSNQNLWSHTLIRLDERNKPTFSISILQWSCSN